MARDADIEVVLGQLSDYVGIFVELEDQVVILSNLQADDVKICVHAGVTLFGSASRAGPVRLHLAGGAAAVSGSKVAVVALQEAEVEAVAAFLDAFA